MNAIPAENALSYSTSAAIHDSFERSIADSVWDGEELEVDRHVSSQLFGAEGKTWRKND